MRARAVVLAVAIVLAPLGARAADLVVWWEQGFYPQEDEALAEMVAAFEQKTGKQVELVLDPRRASGQRSRRRSRPAGRPISPSASSCQNYFRMGARGSARGSHGHRRRLSDLFDPDLLDRATLLNARPGNRPSTALPMGRSPTTSTFGRAFWSGRASRSPTFRASGRRSGRSGAIRSSRPCARPLGRDDIWGVGLPMSAGDDTEDQFFQFVAAYDAGYVTRGWEARDRRPGDQAPARPGHRQLHGDLSQGLHPARFGDLGRSATTRLPRPAGRHDAELFALDPERAEARAARGLLREHRDDRMATRLTR